MLYLLMLVKLARRAHTVRCICGQRFGSTESLDYQWMLDIFSCLSVGIGLSLRSLAAGLGPQTTIQYAFLPAETDGSGLRFIESVNDTR